MISAEIMIPGWGFPLTKIILNHDATSLVFPAYKYYGRMLGLVEQESCQDRPRIIPHHHLSSFEW